MKTILIVCWLMIGFLVLSLFCEPMKDASANTTDDLKWQMKQMEEVVRKQQEMLEDLKMKVELQEDIAQGSVSAIEESTIEGVIDNYMMKEETKKKMVNAGILPQLSTYWDKGLRFKSQDGNFKLKIGGRIMNDWAWMTENTKFKDESGIGDGDLVDGTEFRRARIYLSGSIYGNIGFKAQYDLEDGATDFKDVYIELKKIPFLGNFRVGHFKEPFSLEELTSSKYISFMERNLTNDPFAPGRNTGFMLHNHMFNKRLTWAAGLFRNTDAFGDSDIADDANEGQYSITGRITALPWYAEEGRKLLHVGLSYSRQNAESNSVTFETKPDINLAPDFIDTGAFNVENFDLIGPELALVHGPFSLQTEYSFADVELHHDNSMRDDPEFSGFYVYGSYFITGEHRKYKTKNGTFGRVKPNKNFSWGEGLGAIELLARYSELDLSDEATNTGRLDTITLGANWYLNPNTRVMLNYVKADPTRDSDGDDDGDADLFGMRFQIDF
ncbi:MAG: hypothetical protein MAG551_01159 [Candidatus Scalindua arabica]|uniref:Phosphate-selective porin O and P n=1 Tax=Candidatus Scalindua arabica TaxID=1127984 RepID=A0A942A1Z1_9BACT|nr:hypothetical protein [Candidatus Scalindua arabica]